MNIQEERDRLIKNIQALRTDKKIIENQEIKEKLSELETDIKDNFFMAIVLGEFKRGKSTFINALLKNDLLPTDILPETAVISVLAYHDTPKVEVVKANGSIEEGQADARYLRNFSANNPDFQVNSIRYLKIGYPAEILQHHLVLVDTPGVDDLNEQRCDVTYKFIPKANVVLFLLDAKSPLKKTEMDFIKDSILPLGLDNIIFIINKYDAVDEEEEEAYLSDLQDRIQEAFTDEDGKILLKNIRLYPLSAKWAMEGILRQDERFINASGILPIREVIQQMAFDGTVEQAKLKRWHIRYGQLLDKQIREFERSKTLKEADTDTLKKAAEELQKMLAENKLDTEIIDEFVRNEEKNIEGMVDKSLQYFYDRLSEDIVDNIRFYKGLDFKDYVEQRISKQLKREMENWLVAYAPHIDQLLAAVEHEISRSISYKFNQRIVLKAKNTGNGANESFEFHLNAQDVSDATLHAGVLTAGGAGLMMLIGGPVLMPFISMAAFPFLQRKFLADKLAEAKAQIIPDVQDQLAEAVLKLKKSIHENVSTRCNFIADNAKKAYEVILTEASESIQKQIQEKKESNADLHKEIQTISSKVEVLQKYREQIYK